MSNLFGLKLSTPFDETLNMFIYFFSSFIKVSSLLGHLWLVLQELKVPLETGNTLVNVTINKIDSYIFYYNL